MICGDCKGSGQYVGFVLTEICRTCGGSGKVADGSAGIPLPDGAVKFGLREAENMEDPPLVVFKFHEMVNRNLARLARKPPCWVYVFDRMLRRGGLSYCVLFEHEHFSSETIIDVFRTERVVKHAYALYRRIEEGKNLYKLVQTKSI